MKKVLNKKAQGGLGILSSLIIIVVSLTIGIIFIFQSGIFPASMSFFCPTMTTAGAYARGVPLHIMWSLYDVAEESTSGGSGVIGWVKDKVVGLVTDVEEGTLGKISSNLKELEASIPLFSCQNSAIDMKYSTPCESDKGMTKNTFFKEVAIRTVDCWDMYTAGKYNPTSGKTPPNPRTCFTIAFNLNESTDFYELLDFMTHANYSFSDITYWNKLGYPELEKQNARHAGPRIVLTGADAFTATGTTGDWNNNQDYWFSSFKKGVLFIKYADDGSGGWEDSDCDIKSNPFPGCNPDKEDCSSRADQMPGAYDEIYWCLKTDLTYDKNCDPFTWSGDDVPVNVDESECAVDADCDAGYKCDSSRCITEISGCTGTPATAKCGDYCEKTASDACDVFVISGKTYDKQIFIDACADVGCTQVSTAMGASSTGRCEGSTGSMADLQATNCGAMADGQSCTNAGCTPEY
ncbi:MAG: hypothetical protein PHC66_03750 [Candidatus Nanoarchaeia archaeon]|nr:hypothetical protein [Candidatus Nanoarchaeia archaeon]MDD5239209.1 hypothetical protein [Candidatus Nanoarchaeia archaeon]